MLIARADASGPQSVCTYRCISKSSLLVGITAARTCLTGYKWCKIDVDGPKERPTGMNLVSFITVLAVIAPIS